MTENTSNQPLITGYPKQWGEHEPNPFLPQPPAPKKQAWWTRRWAGPVLLAVGCLLIGGGIGASGKPKEVEVIKEVPVHGPERIVTKEVKVNVPTTPASCLEALTINETAFTYLSESLGHVVDGDYAAASASTERVKALVPKSNAAKAACRAS